jgi:hypothetical protein
MEKKKHLIAEDAEEAQRPQWIGAFRALCVTSASSAVKCCLFFVFFVSSW